VGLDYKRYHLSSFNTNNFINVTIIPPEDPSQPPQVIEEHFPPNAQPTRIDDVNYLPLTLRWDGARPDKYGTTSLSIGYTTYFDLGLFSDSKDFKAATGSSDATGTYFSINGGVTREQRLYEDWTVLLKADGQWANEPLISPEQFGIGGTAGVRGYQEGE